MKPIFLSGLLAMAVSAAATGPELLHPSESEPAMVGGLRFSVVTQQQWKFRSSPGTEETVTVHLKVSNPADSGMFFPTFDSFTPVLTGPDGNPVAFSGGRDATKITPCIFIAGHKDWSIMSGARLKTEAIKGGTRMVFEFSDGTGTILRAPVTPGEWKLSFELRPSTQSVPPNVRLSAPVWGEKGSTSAATFTISAG